MGEIDYWFVKNMYILGVVGITEAVVLTVIAYCCLIAGLYGGD